MPASDRKDFLEWVQEAVTDAAYGHPQPGTKPMPFKVSKVGAYSFEIEWSPDDRWVVTVKYSGRKVVRPGGGS